MIDATCEWIPAHPPPERDVSAGRARGVSMQIDRGLNARITRNFFEMFGTQDKRYNALHTIGGPDVLDIADACVSRSQ